MSHLYWQCQKHKHFCFSNVRFRRGSIVKSVCLVVVVAVSLHHQQTDNFCKIQKKNSKWTWAVIYVWRFIVLSSGHPSKCVCYTALRARGACPLKGYCLLSLFTWFNCSTASSSSEALDEIELLGSWLLAVWWHGWGCDNPGTLSELVSLDTLASSLSVSTTSSDISLGFNNRGLLLLELIIL